MCEHVRIRTQSPALSAEGPGSNHNTNQHTPLPDLSVEIPFSIQSSQGNLEKWLIWGFQIGICTNVD